MRSLFYLIRRRLLVVFVHIHIRQIQKDCLTISHKVLRINTRTANVSKLNLKLAFGNLTGQSKCWKMFFLLLLLSCTFRSLQDIGIPLQMEILNFGFVICTPLNENFHEHKSANYCYPIVICFSIIYLLPTETETKKKKLSTKFDVVAKISNHWFSTYATCNLQSHYVLRQ